MAENKKITQLSTLASNPDDVIDADIQEIDAKKSIYSSSNKPILQQMQSKIQFKIKQEGQQQNDFASHLQTVLRQSGRSLNDFSANFSYLKDIISDENSQKSSIGSQNRQNIFLIQDQGNVGGSSIRKKNKYLDLDEMNDDNKQQFKQEDGDICLPQRGGGNIQRQLKISSEEMKQELKHHESRALKSNVLIKKFVQKGSIFNFKSELFFQCTKVPKNNFFKRVRRF